jgi:hypothetical protein
MTPVQAIVTEMLEAVPEDVDNLRIDMEPQYAFNACLLKNTRKG